jgi:hypothetical protein
LISFRDGFDSAMLNLATEKMHVMRKIPVEK